MVCRITRQEPIRQIRVAPVDACRFLHATTHRKQRAKLSTAKCCLQVITMRTMCTRKEISRHLLRHREPSKQKEFSDSMKRTRTVLRTRCRQFKKSVSVDRLTITPLP